MSENSPRAPILDMESSELGSAAAEMTPDFDPNKPSTSGLPPPETRPSSDSESDDDVPEYDIPRALGPPSDHQLKEKYDWVVHDDIFADPSFDIQAAESSESGTESDSEASPPKKVPRTESSESGTESDGEASPPKKVRRAVVPRAPSRAPPSQDGAGKLIDWVPPSGWAIKRGFLWCPKACRGVTRRALALHVRRCDSCPLNMERKALADIQTWCAPNAEESITCSCEARIHRTKKYAFRKCVQRHIKKSKAHKGHDVTTETNKVLNAAFRTVSTSKRAAIATGLPRVVPKGAADEHADECESEASMASAPSTPSRSAPTARGDPPGDDDLDDLGDPSGGAAPSDEGRGPQRSKAPRVATSEATTEKYSSHAARVLARSVSRIGPYHRHMTAEIMSENMSDATRRAYRYQLRTLLMRAGLLSKDDGLEAFDFRHLLGSPQNVEKVREVLETVFSRHPSTGYLMLNAIKHVLAIIPRRVFLLGDDLAMEWTNLVTIITETLKGEEIRGRPQKRSRRVEKIAERQAELANDIGSERRLAARRAAHLWMSETMMSFANLDEQDSDLNLESYAKTFRQVLFVSVGLMHGQRTQVYAELTLDEFKNAERYPNGSLAAVRLAGKEAAMYGPATAIFPPSEAKFAEFYVSHVRKHLDGARSSNALFPGLLRYPSLQSEGTSRIFGEPVEQLMGNQLRRWHVTTVERLYREGKITSQVRNDLCSFRRHSPKTSMVHYELVTRRERDMLASQTFYDFVGATTEADSGAQGSQVRSTRPHSPVHSDLDTETTETRQGRDLLASQVFSRQIGAETESEGGSQGSQVPFTLGAAATGTSKGSAAAVARRNRAAAIYSSSEEEDDGTAPRELVVPLIRCDQARTPPPRDPEERRPREPIQISVGRRYAEFVSLHRASWAARARDEQKGSRRWSPEELAVVDILVEENVKARRDDVRTALERFELDWDRISSRSILALVLKLGGK